jgi:hypothetical protein
MIRNIINPSEYIQILAVKLDCFNISRVQKPTIEVQKLAISDNNKSFLTFKSLKILFYLSEMLKRLLHQESEIYLSGQLINSTTGSNISGEVISISGFDTISNVTTDTNGIFTLTSSNLTILTSYTPNATVVSSTYTSSAINFTTITIQQLNASIIFENIYQIFGTKSLYMSGNLVKDVSNTAITNETINIYGLDTIYSAVTDNTGSFSVTTANISLGNYSITANLVSLSYMTSSNIPYQLIQAPISANSSIYTYSYVPFTSNITVTSTTRNQQYYTY